MLSMKRETHYSFSLVTGLARDGWTRIGSPGIFGEPTVKRCADLRKHQVVRKRPGKLSGESRPDIGGTGRSGELRVRSLDGQRRSAHGNPKAECST